MSGRSVITITMPTVILVTSLVACDQVGGPKEEDGIELAGLLGSASGPGAQAALPSEVQGPLTTLMQATSSVEVFAFGFEDSFVVNGALGGLFPLAPAGIDAFDEPELANAFMIGFRVYDVWGDLVGFGTEQEVLDLPNSEVATTYTLTLPERGTLMFGQQEDLTVFLGEIDDMVATQELVRTYDPPMVILNTIPGTGQVIGGTGEFAGSTGGAIEIGVLHEINLIEQSFDLGVVLVFGFS